MNNLDIFTLRHYSEGDNLANCLRLFYSHFIDANNGEWRRLDQQASLVDSYVMDIYVRYLVTIG
jgi:hypothetical protein